MRTSAMGLAFGGLLLVGLAGRRAARSTRRPALTLTGAQKPAGVGGVRVGEAIYLRARRRGRGGLRQQRLLQRRRTRVDSATLRVTPSLELTNADRDGNSPPLYLLAGRQPAVPGVPEGRRGGPRAAGLQPDLRRLARLQRRRRRLLRSLSDQFTRLEEPPYATERGPPIIRDYNQAVAQVGLSPRVAAASRQSSATPTPWTCSRTTTSTTPTGWATTSCSTGPGAGCPRPRCSSRAALGYIQYLNDPAEAAGQGRTRFLTGCWPVCAVWSRPR